MGKTKLFGVAAMLMAGLASLAFAIPRSVTAGVFSVAALAHGNRAQRKLAPAVLENVLRFLRPTLHI